MLCHPSSQRSQRLWRASVAIPATLTLFASDPWLLAQNKARFSRTPVPHGPFTTLCSDLFSAPCPPPPTGPTKPAKLSWHPETSLSLGAFAQFTPTRVQVNTYGGVTTGVQTQGIAPTAGVLGTFRQQFRPWAGYSLNMGYTRVDERYTFTSPAPVHGPFHVPSDLYELSLSYVGQRHLSPRLDAFAQVGAGFVTVLPLHRTLSPGSGFTPEPVNFRPEGTTGVGLDLRLAHNFAFRAEYRGLLYKNPDFGSLQKSTTWTSEPTLSLVYRFGGQHSSLAGAGPRHP